MIFCVMAVMFLLRDVNFGRVINFGIRNPNGIDMIRREVIVIGNTISNKSWVWVSSSSHARYFVSLGKFIVSLVVKHLNLSKLSFTGRILKKVIG